MLNVENDAACQPSHPPFASVSGTSAVKYQILPIDENHTVGFCAALDHVARERQYLSVLEGPPLEAAHAFVMSALNNNTPHYVALSNGLVVGWCDIVSFNRPVFSHAGILGIGVLKPYRGQGIGEALLRTTLDKANKIGLTRVELTVGETNKPARALYEKLGFQIEGVRRRATRIDGRYADDLYMAYLTDAA